MNYHINGLKVLKIAGGSLLSMVIAECLGLNYAASAGVITLLSIHDTKRETIRVMTKRMGAFLIALLLAPVCFLWLGYRPAAIGLFLLLFTPACMFLQIQEGISVSTVLMTHFLADGAISGGSVINEVLLLVVGTGVGVVMNLYIPGRRGLIQQKQHMIEIQFRSILADMAGKLGGGTAEVHMGGDGVECKADREREAGKGSTNGIKCEERFSRLEKILEEGEQDAFREMDNSLLAETRYYLKYMTLRKNQLMVLRRIGTCLDWQPGFLRISTPPQAVYISGLICSVSRSFHEHNNASGLLEELEQVKMQMRQQPLPVTREEFEVRAVLFQILLELEQFLVMKREFVEELSEQDIRIFWGR